MVGVEIRRFILAIWLLAGLLIPSEVWAQLQVQPARNAMSINESLRVEITLEDGDPDSLDLTPIERDFEIVARARGSQVNIINGSMNKINTWSLRLVPKRKGTLALPELCAASSCSEPVTIEVSDAPTQPDGAPVIVEHGSLPERVYVGQQILYPVRILFRTPLQQAALDTPNPTGVDVEVIKLGEDQQREMYRDGWRYNVIERVYAIIPAQSGTLHIPPVSMEAQIEDTQESRRRGMQGNFFDPFGTRGQVVRQRTAAAQVEVEPPARPEHPWLPAQELKLHDSWEENQPQLRVGEPATRTISINAQGTSAEHIRDIALEVPSAFKIYPDQPERENISNRDKGISAQLRQSAAIVPREAGNFTLPGITLHWWDLRAQRWSTAHIEPLKVEVLPAERTPQATAPPVKTSPPEGQDGPQDSSPVPQNAPETVPSETEGAAPSLGTTSSAQPSLLFTKKDYLWVGIATLCAAGWLVTTALWWRARKQVKALRCSESEVTPVKAEATKRGSIEQKLLKAAQQHDAHSARHLLQEWAEIHYPTTPAPLDSLCRAGGEQLRKVLRQLNDNLYSANPGNWNGEELAEAIRNVSKEKGKKPRKNVSGEDLPPLYPRA
jgi:hypothetical protein